jgi:hypothetical protein
MGSRRSDRVTSMTSGAITRHIASLTRNAENAPAVIVTVVSRMNGEWACTSAHRVTRRKKPDRRKCATIIIIPSRSASVSRLTAVSFLWRDRADRHHQRRASERDAGAIKP